MMRPFSLGKHLYSQIVVPLVMASLVVGVLATVVAVYFLSNLTDQWVDQLAESATQNLVGGVEGRAQTMAGVAKLAAEDRELRQALTDGDMTEARGVVVQTNVALGFDHVMLLDSAGRVVVASGLATVMPGDAPLGERRAYSEIAMTHPMFVKLGEFLTITVLQPVVAGEHGEEIYTLAVSQIIDQEFLSALSGDIGDVILFYDADGEEVARTIVPPKGVELSGYLAMQGELDASSPALVDALSAAASGAPGKSRLKTESGNFRIWAQRVNLEGNPFPDNYGYLVSVVSQAVSDQAGQTTTNLITMWSVFAVLTLVGLGGWVARRVSDPLAELAEGARRIADGDFSTKMHVSGTNEVSALAESFNQMTDALRERSESLTKKVLELATLYEMSRALGATLEMGVLLDSVLDSALRIFNLDIGYVTIRDRNSGQLAIRAWRGPSTFEPDEQALRSSMSEWVIREGRPLIFNPTGDQNQGDQVDNVSGALAALCVPLTSAEGAIGAIIVGSNDPEFRFNSDDVRLLSTIANHVTIAIGNIELFSSLQDAYLSTVRSLAAAVDAKDPYTRGHSDRVATYSGVIAEDLGLSHEQRVALEMAAYLHDIGKIGIQEAILLKPGRLTDDEMAQMRHHPLIGANILKPVGFPWPITPVVRHHHERWDGMGYPAGLKAEETPLLARILTVADAFEAMISDRPYRRGRTIDEGLAELEACSGTQFDPRVVTAFVEIMRFGDHGQVVVDESFTVADVQPEEARAIFVALAEGMLQSFRKLAGPRLTANVEHELNTAFAGEDFPISVSAGRVGVRFEGLGDFDEEIDIMRSALSIVDDTMSRTSGRTLVDHFHVDALATLSERMRQLSAALGFYSA